jgi:hypothetical protein
MDHPIDAEAGKAKMFSKDPKRIIVWVSKAWTPYEKLEAKSSDCLQGNHRKVTDLGTCTESREDTRDWAWSNLLLRPLARYQKYLPQQ